jgi:cell division protein FtsL
MVRIKEVAGDTSMTYPTPIARRRRPQVGVTVESGFVLILVLPVAMLLLMTALSLVSRSNSAAIASAQESRAQAARMAAEYGFNQLMAKVNTEYDSSNVPVTPALVIGNKIDIDDSPGASYTIVSLVPLPVSPVGSCSDSDTNNVPLYATIEGKLTVGSKDYKRKIFRTLKVCAPASNAKKLRIRGFS